MAEGKSSLYFSAAGWDALARKVVQTLNEYHQKFPARPGMPRVEMGSRLKIGERYPAVIRRLADDGTVAEDGGAVRLPSFQVTLTPAQQSKVDAFLSNIGPTFTKVRPQWRLDIKKMGFSFSSYGAYNNQYYSETKETRVVSPSSYTYWGDLDAELGYDDARLAWENRAKMAYSIKEITQEGANAKSESVDDVVLSTEVAGKVLKVPTKHNLNAYLMPFLSLLYDTEFTPTKDKTTGAKNPHQHLMYGHVGLSFRDEKYLKKIYLSYLAKDDFTQSRGSFESGIGAGFELEIPYKALKLTSELDVRYFPPHKQDSVVDLGLTVRFVNVLTVEIIKGLNLHFTADYILFNGKVAETDHLGMSLILSGGISFSRLFIWNA